MAAWIIPPNTLPYVDLAAQPEYTQNYVKFSHHGNDMIRNKDVVSVAAERSGATDSQRALMMAIAMQVSSAIH